MAVATKTAPAVTRTEYRREVVSPVIKRRRKKRNVVVVRVIAGTIALFGLLCYIGLYAQVTIYGYHKAELSSQIRQMEMQNQAIKAEIQTLSSPDRLAATAIEAGMVPGVDVVYISAPKKVKVARAD